MRTILITGGAGFIAHHLVQEILEKTNWNIVTLDRLDISGNLNRLGEVAMGYGDRIRTVYHDLRAPVNNQLINQIGHVNFIAHMAAGSHVDRSISHPMDFVMDNVVGTANILDLGRHYHNKDSLEHFIYFSTDEVFGPAPEGVMYDEYSRYNSTNPYSATKAGGEELAVAYENCYKMPITITHTMNVFGERQHPEKFIPMCIKKIRDEEKIPIHSNPEKTKAGSRHYIHAKDVADAVLFLLNRPYEGKIEVDSSHFSWLNKPQMMCPKFNIVGSVELDNLQLAHMIAGIIDKPAITEMVNFHSARPGHDLRYALSGNRMRQLGWEPKDIGSRLKEVVEWTLENSDRWLDGQV